MNLSQFLSTLFILPIEEPIATSIISRKRRGLSGFGSIWSNQNQLFLSLPVDKLLAITAYGEASGEGGEGMMAVLNVIRNRTSNLSRFGDSEILSITNSPYHAVILKEKQFSMYNIGDPVRSIAERIASNFDVETSKNSNLQMAYDLADMLLHGQLDDNTGGADHYYNPSVVSPLWAASLQLTGQIGNHIFYKTPGSSYPVPGSTLLASIFPWSSEGGGGESEGILEAGISGGSLGALLLLGAMVGLFVKLVRR